MTLPLLAGTPAPWFKARTHARPDFSFSSVGGFYVLLAFIPEGPDREPALAQLRAHAGLFDDRSRIAFGVISDEAGFLAQHDPGQGLRYFHDPNAHAGVPLHAPVLIVPRILEPGLCRELISYYAIQGGGESGVMREIEGRTVGVIDDFKRRRDATIEDQGLRDRLRSRLAARLLPEIRKALQFEATRMERYIVARYDSADGGYFRPHRDNTTKATAHRQLACSINLNSEEFEGGDLRFPEFGRRTYRPPTGGALVFSCALLHEATPVTRGVRYAFLPFFYNEEAARLRVANQSLEAARAREVEAAPAS